MSFEPIWLKKAVCSDGTAVPVYTPGEGIEASVEREIEVLRGLREDFSWSYMVTEALPEEGYEILVGDGKADILGGSLEGVLYGVFDAMRQLILTDTVVAVSETPACPLRMMNHWDNADGSIERGYSGQSFFFRDGKLLVDDRTFFYARLCASVGINAAVINNVNVKGDATRLITDEYLPKVRELADCLGAYGVKLYLCINFAASMELGGCAVADPLDADVIDYWNRTVSHVYEGVPNLGGFLVKADSEGRPGPFTYGRTQADGANMLARALAPHGGRLIWRCFVYNCSQDWRDTKTDRPCAAYNSFIDLDGKFEDNVILQVKNGPVDFQVREPVSPLFCGMKQTNLMLEVQAAQEYTGQQKHVCFLIPMWKDVLRFHTYAYPENDRVRDIIAGVHRKNANCGIAAVTNTGDDENWTGSDFAAANWYGFGRLAWNPSLSAEQIAEEWAGLTFGDDREVVSVIVKVLLASYSIYERYTVPLGIGWMCNPNFHYGPNVDGYEYDRWGTYHRASHRAIGVDRSSRGTGYAQQYSEPLAKMYDDPATTPQELLLFFHRLPYDYVLPCGSTLIQYIYDTHFEAVDELRALIESVVTVQGLIPEKEYTRIMERFAMQLASAKEWRDRINTYFCRMSGIGDAKHRTIYAVSEEDITYPGEE